MLGGFVLQPLAARRYQDYDGDKGGSIRILATCNSKGNYPEHQRPNSENRSPLLTHTSK